MYVKYMHEYFFLDGDVKNDTTLFILTQFCVTCNLYWIYKVIFALGDYEGF